MATILGNLKEDSVADYEALKQAVIEGNAAQVKDPDPGGHRRRGRPRRSWTRP